MAEDLIGSDNPLSTRQRRTLDVVLDMIVPASADGRKPSAADVGVLDYIREHEADTLPLLGEQLDRLDALAQASGGAFAALDSGRRRTLMADIRAREPTFLHALALHAVTVYYQDARVLEALGMEARPPFPEGYDVPAGDLTLLEPVRRRGSLVREV